jgi:hypothetical protein
MGIVIATVKDHLEYGYRITCWCPRCKFGIDEYPLHRLVMLGKGDKLLSEVRLRHGCGAMLETRRIPPLRPVTPPKS